MRTKIAAATLEHKAELDHMANPNFRPVRVAAATTVLADLIDVYHSWYCTVVATGSAVASSVSAASETKPKHRPAIAPVSASDRIPRTARLSARSFF